MMSLSSIQSYITLFEPDLGTLIKDLFLLSGFICFLNLMMVNAAVVNDLQATMNVEESLKSVFTQEGHRGCFSHIMVL